MSKTADRLKMPVKFADMIAESMEYDGGSGDLNWKEITGFTIIAVGLVFTIIGGIITARSLPVRDPRYKPILRTGYYLFEFRSYPESSVPLVTSPTGIKVGIGMMAAAGVMMAGNAAVFGYEALK